MIASSKRGRRGSAIVPVLLCFVLILLISGGLLKIGLAQRGQIGSEERALQTEWLVESGIERAAAKLAVSADYQGETWNLTPDEMNGPWPGTVTISAARPEGNSRARRVTIAAEYPSGADRRNRQHKTVVVERKADKEGANR